MIKRKLVYILLFVLLFIPFLGKVSANGEISALTSYIASKDPTIDGTFTESEWEDAYNVSFFHEPDPIYNHPDDYVHVYIKNTQNKLYILFDDLPDNSSDPQDHVYIYFDCNYDGIRDDNISMRLGRGSNGFIGDIMANWSFGFGSTPNKLENHTIIEIAINISFSQTYNGKSRPEEIGYALPVGNSNKTIRIMFSAAEYVSGWEIPQTLNTTDPTTYAELTLDEDPPEETPDESPDGTPDDPPDGTPDDPPPNIPFGSFILLISIFGVVVLILVPKILERIKFLK